MRYLVEVTASPERGNPVDDKGEPAPVFAYIVQRFKPAIYGDCTQREGFMILDLPTLLIRKTIGLMRYLASVTCIVLVASLAQAQASKETSPKLSAELERVRSALIKYQDPIKAVRDGYFSTVGCVRYPAGGMGVHFLNPQLIGPVPDPMRPQILVYEPVGDKLVLLAAEWFIPLATGAKGRPQLFGHPFDGPMEGHEPLIPAALHHYDLHVWLFKPNPAGLFNVVNPNVKCPKTGYSFLEHPPRTVPHQ